MTLAQPVVHQPFAYQVGPLKINGFTLALALGFLIGHILCRRELARRGHDTAFFTDAVLASVIGFIIGAKLYYALQVGDFSTLLRPGGLVFWGGVTGGVAVGLWMTRHAGVPMVRAADVTGIGIAAGYAVGRTGCFAIGDDYGRPWNSPFAVAFPRGEPPSTAANLEAHFGIAVPDDIWPGTVLTVHPTQLYEVTMGFVMFLILWRLRDHKHAEGWLFGVYMVLAGIERFAVEFLRAKDDRLVAGISLAQVISVLMVAAGLIWMRARRDVTATAPGIYAPEPSTQATEVSRVATRASINATKQPQ